MKMLIKLDKKGEKNSLDIEISYDLAKDIAEAIQSKDEKRLIAMFKNIKDINNKIYNIELNNVESFEFLQ